MNEGLPAHQGARHARLEVSPGVEINYVHDDYTDPWIRHMARTAVSTEAGFVGTINFSDITKDVAAIRCPMLVLTTVDSNLATVEQIRAWQQQVPHSELKVLPGNSFHVAATDPDACVEATLEFIRRHADA